MGWQFCHCFDYEKREQAEHRLRQFIRTCKHRELEAVSVIEANWLSSSAFSASPCPIGIEPELPTWQKDSLAN